MKTQNFKNMKTQNFKNMKTQNFKNMKTKDTKDFFDKIADRPVALLATSFLAVFAIWALVWMFYSAIPDLKAHLRDKADKREFLDIIRDSYSIKL